MKHSAHLFLPLLALMLAPPACKRDDMADQLRYKPLAKSSFYNNGASARPLVAHTVARNAPFSTADDTAAWQDRMPDNQHAPFLLTRADLTRGQTEFQIYCTPCHGQLGDGDGMIPSRGFTRPATYHSDRLRNAPDAYFYNVITFGIGAMYPYRSAIVPDDRWRIVAYIRGLQLSQHASPNDIATSPASAPERSVR